MKRNFFDEINANKRNSVIMTALFFAFVIFIGYVLGFIYGSPVGGIVIAAIIAGIYSLIVFSSGEEIILKANNAKPADKRDNAYIINTVEGLAIAAGLPVPKVYIIQDEAINAFATGKDPKHSYIAITTGAIKKLNREELEGVIAHEMSHIKNYDIRLMLTVIVLIGTVAILSQILLRSFLFGGGRRNDRENGSIVLLFIAVGLVLAILSPIIAELTKLAISRKREYLADSSGAMLTRNPDGLAKALKKIKSENLDMKSANKATANLYISNPIKKGFTSNLWSTHPPIEERIKRLNEM